jgi:hypothetical protein
VKASPLSKTFVNRLDALENLYPKKVSVIHETVSGNHEAGLRGLEIAELQYDGLVLTHGIPQNSSLSVTYLDGWIIDAITGNITWYDGEGNAWVIIGPENDSWSIIFETFEWVSGYSYELVVIVSRWVSKTFLVFHEYSKHRTI